MSTHHQGQTYRLLLDARAAFPYLDPTAKQSTLAWSQTPAAAAALAVLPAAERDAVLRYYFPKDAALALGSKLIKHYIIVHTRGVAWSESHVQQDRSVDNGKPYFGPGGLEFNVSHHGTAVVLIATTKPDVKVGIDLTEVDANTAKRLRAKGFDDWLAMFEGVFSDSERQHMHADGPQGTNTSIEAISSALRTFHSYWALKEAYFKMTGDALLADWLNQLEFRNVKPPRPTKETVNSPWAVGEITLAAAALKGVPVEDTQLELAALGADYIVATSLTSFETLPPFEELNVERDILPMTK